jgi:hypothetical protein
MGGSSEEEVPVTQNQQQPVKPADNSVEKDDKQNQQKPANKPASDAEKPAQ